MVARPGHHHRMRPLSELINIADDGWVEVDRWVQASVRPVEILEGDRLAGEQTLYVLQVTSRSTLGAIALHCGGILIDHGWLRILGSGHPRMGNGLRGWNAVLGGPPLEPPLDQALVVAYDVLGGLYAINGGRWTTHPGTVHYFSPDSFAWESMDIAHGTFVEWTLSDKLDLFYKDWRWPGWGTEVTGVGPDSVISVWPPLGFKGSDGRHLAIGARGRRPVPAREHWGFANHVGQQIAALPDGASVRFNLSD
jgi:hypothetical protein